MQREQGKTAVVTLSAVAFTLGLAAFAVSDQAEARKGFAGAASGTYKLSPTGRGGVSTLPTTGKAKANPPPVVRDHRGEPKVGAPLPHGYHCHRGNSCIPPLKTLPKKNIRDHRGPRVVPKEDPPQKW